MSVLRAVRRNEAVPILRNLEHDLEVEAAATFDRRRLSWS